MREKIIEVIYEGWCERYYGNKSMSSPETDEAISEIVNMFHGGIEEELFVEETIEHAILAEQKRAFMQGFEVCLGLLKEPKVENA